MKKWAGHLLAAAIVLAALLPSPAHAAVIISELCDPLNNYTADRFIEIANAGTDSVDLAGWTLIAVGNGLNIQTWPLSGRIAPGQAWVAGNVHTVTVFPVTFGDDAWGANNGTWNGKSGDGAKLVDAGGTLVDYAVVPGTMFENMDMVRKPTIYTPNTVWTTSEWTATAVTLATDASPGTHALNPRPPGPAIRQVVTEPSLPRAGLGTDVRAAVTDSAATITSVTLLWGTSAGSLSNSVPMPWIADSTYRTGSPIPGQAAGTTVYYKVQASDASATNTSDLGSYTLDYEVTVHQVQGEVSSSPYNGLGVITHGIVTAVYPSYFVVQDGSGAWNGLWVRSSATPARGDSVVVRGLVTESDVQGLAGNTLLTSGLVLYDAPGSALPTPAPVTTAMAASEAYEGVLVGVGSADCTDPSAGLGQWLVNDGSGACHVGPLGYAFTPILGTTYAVTGPVLYGGGAFLIEPRDGADVVWVADHSAPVVVALFEENDSTLRVTFSEPVDPASAATPGHYTVGSLTATGAGWNPYYPAEAIVTVPGIPPGSATLTATGVADLYYGNATTGATWTFNFVDTSIPAGYYDSALGLRGTALRAALHEIIKNHASQSYDYALTAFQTTDVKPNHKVWDVYSDIPGGTPPYEYTFGQTGGGTTEGSGYNREHSWPKTWFGGTVLPMYSDLWILYPTDTKVNNYRGDLPYGDVAIASTTSLNGSQVGSCADAGYAGTVFEPVDGFKGDLARSYFYVSTRYYTEDGAWPGGPATSGADLLPWANTTYLAWHAADPVSQKERLRNGAIYVIQHNRNPFVDHPEFAALLFDSTSTGAVGDEPGVAFRLHQNVPNPFRPTTTIRFDLPARAAVTLRIYDVAGRLVRSLVVGSPMDAGRHEAVWNGRSESGRAVGAGLYFCRLEAGSLSQTRRMVLTN
jgi:endonuclease I